METKETLELIRLAKQGDIKARNELIERNIKIVYKINHMYGNTEDGLHEGILAFCHAIEKFDESKNVKLSSYAFRWIEQRIKRYKQKEKYQLPTALIEKTEPEERIRLVELGYQNFLEKDEKISEEDMICLKNTLNAYIEKVCSKREAFILRKIYIERYMETEISKQLSISRQRVNTIKKRALMKLGKVIYENHSNDRRKK